MVIAPKCRNNSSNRASTRKACKPVIFTKFWSQFKRSATIGHGKFSPETDFDEPTFNRPIFHPFWTIFYSFSDIFTSEFWISSSEMDDFSDNSGRTFGNCWPSCSFNFSCCAARIAPALTNDQASSAPITQDMSTNGPIFSCNSTLLLQSTYYVRSIFQIATECSNYIIY